MLAVWSSSTNDARALQKAAAWMPSVPSDDWESVRIDEAIEDSKGSLPAADPKLDHTIEFSPSAPHVRARRGLSGVRVRIGG